LTNPSKSLIKEKTRKDNPMEWIFQDQDDLILLKLKPQSILFKILKNTKQKQIGLLNWAKIPLDQGCVFRRTKVFHSFGMQEPFTLFFLKKDFKTFIASTVVQPNEIIFAPRHSCWSFECHQDHAKHLPQTSNQIKKIAFSKPMKTLLKILLSLSFLCVSLKGKGETIFLKVGEKIVYDFPDTVQSLHLSRPDLVKVEKQGLLSQRFSFLGLKDGHASLTVTGLSQANLNYDVVVSRGTQQIKRPQSETWIQKKLKQKIQALSLSLSFKENEPALIHGHLRSPAQFESYFFGVAIPYGKFVIANFSLDPNTLQQALLIFKSYLKQIGYDIQVSLKHRSVLLQMTSESWSNSSDLKELSQATFPDVIFLEERTNVETSNIELTTFFYEDNQNEENRMGWGWSVQGRQLGFQMQPKLEINPSQKPDQPLTLNLKSVIPIHVFLDVFKGQGSFKEIASPRLIIRPNETGYFHSGGEFAMAKGPVSNEQSPSYHYKPWGLLLEAKPKLLGQNHLIIDFKLSSKNRGLRSSGDQLPELYTSEVRSTIVIPSNHAASFGGLKLKYHAKEVIKIPILGEIPLLGRLFQRNLRNIKEKTLYFALCAKRLNLLEEAPFDLSPFQQKF
jgi:Flp pilus assembly secretin CpaC